MLLTPSERRALLTLVSLLILGQLASIWREHRRSYPDRELSAWMTRVEAVRADTMPADTLFSDSSGADRTEDSLRVANGLDSAAVSPVEPWTAAPEGILECGRLKVNLATASELEALPGIGPTMARRIVEERARSGPFRRPEDLLKVKGIGPKTLDRLRDQIDLSL